MDKEQFQQMNRLLKSESMPAFGCTGPIAVAYAAAEARSAIGGVPRKITVFMDKDMCTKNSDVGIPGTAFKGQKMAASLGAFAGDASKKLEVLNSVAPEDEAKARAFVAQGNVTIDVDWETEILGVYIDVTVETDLGVGRAIVAKRHDQLVFQSANGQVLIDIGFDRCAGLDESQDDITQYSLMDLYTFVTQCDVVNLYWLRDALRLNQALADIALAGKAGVGIGKTLRDLSGGDLTRRAKAAAAAGIEGRMSGTDLPAMSCAGSGNAGITGALAIRSLAQDLERDEEAYLRALALCYFTTCLGKNRIGRHSAMCACAVVASCGVAAGAALLMGGDYEQVSMAINNTVLNVFGIVCDGARNGCAMKVSSAAGIAIEGALLAMRGVGTPANEGVTCSDGEKTINFMGSFAKEGMRYMDMYLCKALYAKQEC